MAAADISIIKINGKDFVAGLMWEPLSRQRAHMAQAREIGKRAGMDIVAIRLGTNMVQAGFVKKENGITKGMYSLASALAGQIKHESWVGAFELPDGLYALVAVHLGVIVPGCDFVGDKETIRNLLIEKDSQRTIMEFDRVFHPADFQHRGEPLDIANVLVPGEMVKAYALKALHFGLSKQEIFKLTALALVLLGLAGGYALWADYKHGEAVKEANRLEQLRLKKLAELSALAGTDQPLQALLHPWASMPGVEDFLNGCQGAIDALPLAIGGWTFESALCNASTVESVFARTGKTTFNQLLKATEGRFQSPPVLMAGADRAGFGETIQLGAGGDDELMPLTALQADFTSHLQQLDLNAEMVEMRAVALPAVAPLPGSAPVPTLVPTWKRFSFSLVSPYTPKTIFSGLNLRGVRLTELSVARQGQQLNWSVKGEVYAD